MNCNKKQRVDEICSDYCENSWCILKEFVCMSSQINMRTLLQLKCIEKFKFEQSDLNDKEYTWDEATFMWADKYADKFNRYYTEEITFKELYKKILS